MQENAAQCLEMFKRWLQGQRGEVAPESEAVKNLAQRLGTQLENARSNAWKIVRQGVETHNTGESGTPPIRRPREVMARAATRRQRPALGPKSPPAAASTPENQGIPTGNDSAADDADKPTGDGTKHLPMLNVEFIKAWMNEEGWTNETLAQELKISERAVSSLRNNGEYHGLDAVTKLANLMGRDPADLYVTPEAAT
jgi:hypothetical protein